MVMTQMFTTRVALLLWIFLFMFQMPTQIQAETPERIEWNKTPIQLVLSVDQERQVSFPTGVQVGVPSRLKPLLRVQSVNGTVYFLSRAPFDTTRVMVRGIDGGPIYILDISSNADEGSSNPIQIFTTEHKDPQSDNNAPFINNTPHPTSISYVSLTRFAAQQLYAPARLLEDVPGVVRIPVTREAVNLLRGGSVEAKPLVAWRAGGLYLTAIKLTNQTSQARELDPRNLRGAWLTASFQHNRLLPRGDEADTTAVYLISTRPFEMSL